MIRFFGGPYNRRRAAVPDEKHGALFSVMTAPKLPHYKDAGDAVSDVPAMRTDYRLYDVTFQVHGYGPCTVTVGVPYGKDPVQVIRQQLT